MHCLPKPPMTVSYSNSGDGNSNAQDAADGGGVCAGSEDGRYD